MYYESTKIGKFIAELRKEKNLTQEHLFYIYAEDANGNGYYVIKNDLEAIKKIKDFIKGFPLDFVIASQAENALAKLNLTKNEQNEIISRHEEYALSLKLYEPLQC